MVDFICMAPVDLPGAHRKRKNAKPKILAHSGTREIEIGCLTSHATIDVQAE